MDEQPLYTAEQMRALDRAAMSALAIPGYTLMTRAAAAALRALRAHWPRAWKIAVLCGAGNNAGDGYVLARLALAAGLDVTVLYLTAPEQLQGDARTAWQEARAAGVPIRTFTPSGLNTAEVIVDALLGTGLTRPLAADWVAAVQAVNAARVPVLALDIPSGLSADSGAVLGAAVRADLTVTFIAAKFGLFTGAGPDHAGKVELADLAVPEAVLQTQPPCAWRIGADGLADALPAPRLPSAHKGSFGTVLVIGGQPGMSGAVRLAAEAAARVGAGRVLVATHPAHAAVLNSGRPELMCHGIEASAELHDLIEQADVLAVGPGLGQGAWAQALMKPLWDCPRPLLLDADALNLLALAPRRRDDWILTPHPGEAARLLGADTHSVQNDRRAAVLTLQEKYGGVVVLKGAGSLIADGGRVRLASAGNPGMASAGMGDVLTGVIAAMLAQGLPAAEAAAVGVVLHGCAGDSAAAEGERGLLAGDLFAELRRWVNPVP